MQPGKCSLFALSTFVAASVCSPKSMAGSAAVTNLLPPMHWTAEQDHRQMMEQLGIKKLRPGAEGMNRRAANYQNTDEATANPYPNLPDPLTLNNGRKVRTPTMWWKERRPEIVEAFDRDVYGRVPQKVPKVTWKLTSVIRTNNGSIPVTTKKLVGHVDNSSYPLITVNIPLTLTTPANATGPVPVMLHFGFDGSQFFHGSNRFRGFPGVRGPNWEQLVLSNGWGYAVIIPTAYQADNGAGLTGGIIGLCNKGQPRKPDDWGASRAWAGARAAPWIIWKLIPPWLPRRSASKAFHDLARRRWSPWLTTSGSPLPWWDPPAKAGRHCSGVTSVKKWKISPGPVNIIGWREFF